MAAVVKSVIVPVAGVEMRSKSLYLEDRNEARGFDVAVHGERIDTDANDEISDRLFLSESFDLHPDGKSNDEGLLMQRYASQSSLDSIERCFVASTGSGDHSWIEQLNDGAKEYETEFDLTARLKNELIGIERIYEEFERCVQRLPGFKDSRNYVDPNAPLIYGSTPPEQGVYLYGDPIGVGITVPHLEKFQDTTAFKDKIPQTTASSSAVTPRASGSAAIAPKAIQSRPATSTTVAGTTSTSATANNRPRNTSTTTSSSSATDAGPRKISLVSSSTRSARAANNTATTNRNANAGNNYEPHAAGGRSYGSSAAEARYYQQSNGDDYYQNTGAGQRYYTNSKYQQQGGGRGGGSAAESTSTKQDAATASRNWRSEASPQQQSEASTRKVGDK